MWKICLILKKSDVSTCGKDNVEPFSYKKSAKAEGEEDVITWEKGMKLEVLDPLDTWKELRVATVIEVMNDGFLKVGTFFERIPFFGN